MIGKLIPAAMLLMTAACASYAYNQDGPCDASDANALVGQPATSELGSEALQRTGARSVRWIRPGDAVTMDYRPDRLNIKLDAANRVTGFSCG